MVYGSDASIAFWSGRRNNRLASLPLMVIAAKMRKEELKQLVESTSDPAFVVDGDGVVVAWNLSAQELFGVTSEQAIGERCCSIVRGMDECGAVCSENCTVQQAISRSHPLKNFDLEVETVRGKQWANVSVLTAQANGSRGSFGIHILRPADLRKRLEMMVRDFVVNKTGLSPEQAVSMMSSRAAGSESDLTERELEILRGLGRGGTTKSIAEQFHISHTTVNNHVQHILRKLDAHSRLEAIHRAEHAGLI